MSVLLVNGNSLSVPLADESVHCVVTSPPYWSLRDYGVNGQLGLERTPEEYVANMVAVFREVWRVLRKDGTLWLNLGDCFGHGTSAARKQGKRGIGDNTQDAQDIPRHGGEAKQLIGIPWRVAFALQADGWYLRSDIVWSKPNPMPESVTDRPTKAHEYLFLLAKAQKYYYDADAVREEYTKPLDRWGGDTTKETDQVKGNQFAVLERPGREHRPDPAGRNRRTVWEIVTQPYSGAHFATFPEKLVEPCIKAGTSERGVCPVCGKGWRRVVEKVTTMKGNGRSNIGGGYDHGWEETPRGTNSITTTGWQPACSHDADPIPAIIFDPFAGSGTTLVVARKLGRHGVGLDLSRKYLAENARARLELDKWDAWVKP